MNLYRLIWLAFITSTTLGLMTIILRRQNVQNIIITSTVLITRTSEFQNVRGSMITNQCNHLYHCNDPARNDSCHLPMPSRHCRQQVCADWAHDHYSVACNVACTAACCADLLVWSDLCCLNFLWDKFFE